MAKLSAALPALLLLTLRSADAFTAATTSGRGGSGGAAAAASINKRPGAAGSRVVEKTNPCLSMAPSPEESAKALSDYMAKSHEEKLRAVKAMEDKKNAEIEALKNDIASMKSSTSGVVSNASPLAKLPEGSREELAAKLSAYQKFMAEYIVKAQVEKVKAIKAAEVAAENKFADKLVLLGAPAQQQQLSIPSQTTAAEPKLYADRNAKVSAAARAGKSRWGDMENQRASGGGGAVAVGVGAANGAVVAAAPAPAVPPAAAAAVTGPVPPEVEAADHGLRNDGGVGGPTLAERVALGAAGGGGGTGAASVAVAAPSSATTTLYGKRNAMVAAAAKAGRSRWGEKEVQKSAAALANGRALSASAASPAPAAAAAIQASPEVIAADHGLRADGGVGGPTLAERVALGATGGGGSAVAVAAPSSAATTLYGKRNAMVAAAAKAGRSRWGEREVQKSAAALANGRALSDSATASAAEVVAADHGLRADGGVSGPSLTERVNLGAQLLQNA